MAYRIEFTHRARQDIRDAVGHIRYDSPKGADRWFRKLEQIIDSLKDMSDRFAVIPEAEKLGKPYRCVLHYSHRVIYRVDEKAGTVIIVRIYHGARKPLGSGEVEI